MQTDCLTDIAETRVLPVVELTPKVVHITRTEADILRDTPSWGYLWDPSLPVRPANEDELAEYESRRGSVDWHWLYRQTEDYGPAAEAAEPSEPAPDDDPDGQDAGTPDHQPAAVA